MQHFASQHASTCSDYAAAHQRGVPWGLKDKLLVLMAHLHYLTHGISTYDVTKFLFLIKPELLFTLFSIPAIPHFPFTSPKKTLYFQKNT